MQQQKAVEIVFVNAMKRNKCCFSNCNNLCFLVTSRGREYTYPECYKHRIQKADRSIYQRRYNQTRDREYTQEYQKQWLIRRDIIQE